MTTNFPNGIIGDDADDVADSGLVPRHLWCYDRVAPEFPIDPSSDFDLVAKYRGYTRDSVGADDWRWLYGHSIT